jgi:hypothetical protein
MTEPDVGDEGRTDDPPAANQQKTEPMPPSPPQGERFVSDADTSGEMPVDPPHGLADPTGRATPPDTVGSGDNVTPADSGGLSASGQARPAVAAQGKPDGEVDTRSL